MWDGEFTGDVTSLQSLVRSACALRWLSGVEARLANPQALGCKQDVALRLPTGGCGPADSKLQTPSLLARSGLHRTCHILHHVIHYFQREATAFQVVVDATNNHGATQVLGAGDELVA